MVILNTKKDSENENRNNKVRKTPSKNDFRIAVDEEESYRELEKLSNIHAKNNIFGDENNNFSKQKPEVNKENKTEQSKK